MLNCNRQRMGHRLSLALLLFAAFHLPACSTWETVRPTEVQQLESDKPVIRVLLKDGSQFVARHYELVGDTLVTSYQFTRRSNGRRQRTPLNEIYIIEVREDMQEMPVLFAVAGLMGFFVAIGVAQGQQQE